MQFKNFIFIIIGFLLSFSVFADEQTFTNIIQVNINFTSANNNLNSSEIGTITIITEQDTHTYNTLTNTTNSFNFNLKRNVTGSVDIASQLNNFTGNVNSLVQTCNQITQQYGDVNKYFNLYATCNSERDGCNKAKETQKAKLDEFTHFKGQYEECSNDLSEINKKVNLFSNEIIPSWQANMTAMRITTDKANKSKWLYAIIGAAIVAVIFAWKEAKLTPRTSREKQPGLTGRRI